jgi:hypothetical protein
MSFISSWIQMSIGQMSSSFVKVAWPPNSSNTLTILIYLLATAKWRGVLPIESLQLTWAPYLNKIFMASKLLDKTAKWRGVDFSWLLHI